MEKKEIDIIEMSIKEIKGLIYEISQAYDSERRLFLQYFQIFFSPFF